VLLMVLTPGSINAWLLKCKCWLKKCIYIMPGDGSLNCCWSKKQCSLCSI